MQVLSSQQPQFSQTLNNPFPSCSSSMMTLNGGSISRTFLSVTNQDIQLIQIVIVMKHKLISILCVFYAFVFLIIFLGNAWCNEAFIIPFTHDTLRFVSRDQLKALNNAKLSVILIKTNPVGMRFWFSVNINHESSVKMSDLLIA